MYIRSVLIRRTLRTIDSCSSVPPKALKSIAKLSFGSIPHFGKIKLCNTELVNFSAANS